MATRDDRRPLDPPIEQAILGAFARRIHYPVSETRVLQGTDTWVDGERCATLVVSAVFNRTRRFAILAIPLEIPTRTLRFAGQTAASVLNSRIRREDRPLEH